MANYNLTNQTIDSTFNQLLQKNETTGYLVDGTGSVVDGLQISGNTSGSFVGDGSGLTNVSAAIPAGTVSGSSQVDYPLISNIPSGIVSGSSQVSYPELSNIPSGIVSSSDQLNLSGSDIYYNNQPTSLTSSNVQDAITELDMTKAPISALSSNLIVYPTNAPSSIPGYFTLVASPDDNGYNTTAVNIPTGTISGSDQFIAALATTGSLFQGNPGVINITTFGNVRRTGGGSNSSADFYFEVYKRSGSVETLIATSNNTTEVNAETYEQFFATALLNNGNFTEDDVIVTKYYGSLINPAGADPSFDFQFGGEEPIRTLIPVPASVITDPTLTLRVNNLEIFTQSQEELNTTFATTGSNTFYGSQTFDMSGNPANNLQITGSNVFIKNPFTGQTTQMNGGSVFFPSDGVFMTDEGFKTRRASTSDNELTLSTNPYSFTAFNAPTGSLLNQVGLFFNRDSEFNNVLPTNGIITISTGSAYDGVIHIGDGLDTKIDGNLELGGVFNTPNTLRFIDTQGGPGIMMEIKSGNPNSVLTVINSAAASGFGSDLLVQGASTFVGNTKFTGNTETSGQISGSSVQIQGTALNSITNESASPALVLNVGDSSGSILELVNQGATGIFGYGAKFSRNVDIAGTFEAITTAGGHNLVNNNAAADLVTTIGDNTGIIMEIVNSAASGVFGYGVKLSRDLRVESNTTITEVLNLGAQDPLPTGTSGDLAVSGSNLYFHNGASWSQIN